MQLYLVLILQAYYFKTLYIFIIIFDKIKIFTALNGVFKRKKNVIRCKILVVGEIDRRWVSI
jgi:hypothetical protein